MTAALTVPFNPYEMGDTFDPATISWVLDRSLMPGLQESIAGASEVVIDLETTGLNEHEIRESKWGVNARVSMAALTLPQTSAPYDPQPTTYVVPLSHPEGPFAGIWQELLREIVQVMRDSGVPISNQNVKFDARWWFAHTGVDVSSQLVWDTQVSSHLLDENESTKLKDRAPATFGVRRWDDHDLSTPAASEKVPLFDLGEYAARDTYWTWRLRKLHAAEMFIGVDLDEEPPIGKEETDLARLGRFALWCAMPMVATLTAIEQRGFLLDQDWTREVVREEEANEARTLAPLLAAYPIPGDLSPSFAPTSTYFKEWAARAVDAGDLRVTALTPGGSPQWNKSVLTRQARTGSVVAQTLLDYRSAVKRLEYLRSWLDKVSPEGRIHAGYRAGRVSTGRLSCADPNLQQVSKVLKPAFLPSPGYYIAELDYSQIELRAAAFIARCLPMIEAFRRGEDLHTLLAARITGKDPEDVTPPERQAGKSANFGLLYLMGAEGFREYAEDVYGVQFTVEEAEAVHALFFEQWTGMREWHVGLVAQAHREGQVVSPLGRVRRLPALESGSSYRVAEAERQAVNSVVQSFASDVMQLAAASIEGTLPGSSRLEDIRIVATIHDSIVVEVPINDWKRATARAMRRMLDMDETLARLGCVMDVPLAVEASVGTRWGLSDIGTIK